MHDNISKRIEILMPKYTIKSEFMPSKTIEYLEFVINTEDMTIILSHAKKMVIFNMCTSFCCTNSCFIRDVSVLLEKFSSTLI